jgi:hypothetical protein
MRRRNVFRFFGLLIVFQAVFVYSTGGLASISTSTGTPCGGSWAGTLLGTLRSDQEMIYYLGGNGDIQSGHVSDFCASFSLLPACLTP